jgi:hypothetical protein
MFILSLFSVFLYTEAAKNIKAVASFIREDPKDTIKTGERVNSFLFSVFLNIANAMCYTTLMIIFASSAYEMWVN